MLLLSFDDNHSQDVSLFWKSLNDECACEFGRCKALHDNVPHDKVLLDKVLLDKVLHKTSCTRGFDVGESEQGN